MNTQSDGHARPHLTRLGIEFNPVEIHQPALSRIDEDSENVRASSPGFAQRRGDFLPRLPPAGDGYFNARQQRTVRSTSMKLDRPALPARCDPTRYRSRRR